MPTSNPARTPASRLRAPLARRAIAGLVAAVACAMGLQVIAADRAHAACYEVGGSTTIAYQCDIYGSPHYTGGGGGGGGGGTGYQEMVGIGDEGYGGGGGYPTGTGVEQAGALLNNDTCAHHIAGKTGKTADQVRAIYNKVPKPIVNGYHPESSTAFASAPFGAGEQGEIKLYTPYVLVKPDTIKGLLPEGTQLSRPLTREEVQAVIVLHETAHLTGALDHGSNLPAVDPVFNMMIINACFDVIKRPI
jgi:hypothetical protein